MGDYWIALEPSGIFNGDVFIRKLTEASGKAVYNGFFIKLFFYINEVLIDLLFSFFAYNYLFLITINGGNLLNRQAHPVDCYHFDSP